MTRDEPDRVLCLLAESLKAWRIDGSVERASDGCLIVSDGAARVCIEAAPPSLPFRWFVTHGSRRRGAVSLVAVLRQVRSALDPGYEMTRVRIAASNNGQSSPSASQRPFASNNATSGGRTS